MDGSLARFLNLGRSANCLHLVPQKPLLRQVPPTSPPSQATSARFSTIWALELQFWFLGSAYQLSCNCIAQTLMVYFHQLERLKLKSLTDEPIHNWHPWLDYQSIPFFSNSWAGHWCVYVCIYSLVKIIIKLFKIGYIHAWTILCTIFQSMVVPMLAQPVVWCPLGQI